MKSIRENGVLTLILAWLASVIMRPAGPRTLRHDRGFTWSADGPVIQSSVRIRVGWFPEEIRARPLGVPQFCEATPFSVYVPPAVKARVPGLVSPQSGAQPFWVG